MTQYPSSSLSTPATTVIEAQHTEKGYWRDLWHYRELMYFLAWRDIAVRYKQTAIGALWAVIRPALTMLVFVGFRRLSGMPSGSVPAPLLVFAAVLPWQFFSTALTESSGSLIGNANLVSKVYFPRVIVPVSSVITSLVDFLITLVLLGGLMLWYGYPPTVQVLALPIFTGIAFCVALGAGLLFAALNVKYRDFRYVVPFIVQFGLFVSPIAFRASDVPARWQKIIALNPMTGIIDGFRWCILGPASPLDVWAVFMSAIVGVFFCVIGIWYFRRTERQFADVI